MFPDILKLIVGFGRIAAYICTIVGVAFCVTLIYNHLQRLRLSGQTKSASGKTEIESAINEKSDAKEHTE
jgi:hypothetical protein